MTFTSKMHDLVRHSLLTFFWLTNMSINAQETGIAIDRQVHDYGIVDTAASLHSRFTITNTGDKPLYILRADAVRALKVKAYKRKVEPGDTTTLTIYYFPEKTGKFNESIMLHSSATPEPVSLVMKGELKHLVKVVNPLTACYTFGGQPPEQTEEVRVPYTGPKQEPPPQREPPPAPPVPGDSGQYVEPKRAYPPHLAQINDLPAERYKPNNVVFLIDVSGSMKDSTKLPLLKASMIRLLRSLRETDRLAIVTYATEARLLLPSTPADDKTAIAAMIDSLSAKGLTAGNEGIDMAYEAISRNHIEGGNNQIFLATDGAFNLSKANEELFSKEAGTVQMSVIGFGEKGTNLIRSLKGIAKRSKGRFVHIRNRKQAKTAILREIMRSSRF